MQLACLIVGGLNLLVVLFLAWMLSGQEEAEPEYHVGFRIPDQEEDPEDGC